MVSRESSRYHLAVAAILLVGAALRTIEYAALGSLWVDELFIALNVTRRDWWDLVSTPLAYNQVAPIGFLLATKLGTVLLGEAEAGLRLFPYLVSLLGLILFWRVADRFLEPVACLGAVAIFALSPTLLWYSRNVKQYSGDIAVALLLVLLAIRFRDGRQDSRQAAIAGALGGIAILFSQPAVLVAFVLVIVLGVQQWRKRAGKAPLAVLTTAWGLGAAIVTVTSLVLSPTATREFMRAGWEARGFLPFGFLAVAWLYHRLMILMGLFVGQFSADTPAEIAVAGVFVVLAVIGIAGLLTRTPGKALLLSAPVLAGVLASVVRILPLNQRVSLYLAPFLLVMSLAGVDEIRRWLPGRAGGIAHAGTALLVAIPTAILLFLIPIPHRREEARPVLEEIRSHWQPGDIVFVPSGVRAMEFYGPPLGIDTWVKARFPGGNPRTLFWDVDAFRGRPRVWLFYTHANPCRIEILRSYLEAIGTERVRIEDPHGKKVGKSDAAAYLYDLSDPELLKRSRAKTHPAPARITDDCTELPNGETQGSLRYSG